MASKPTVILATGGIRSLIGLALTVSAAEKTRVVLLHLKDGRPNAAARLDCLHRQAEHYRVQTLLDFELPHLQTEEFAHEHSANDWPALVRPQMLLVSLAQAIDLDAGKLIWCAQVNGDYDTIARITEQIVLTQQLAQLETAELPAIETPLLELTDREMIELGAQLDVPFELAWTCFVGGEPGTPAALRKPCRMCEGCKRRKAAFEAAGVVDPIEKPVAVAR